MNKIMNFVFVLIGLSLFVGQTYAVDDPLKGPNASAEVSVKEIIREVDVLGDLKTEDYFTKIDSLLSKIDRYIEYRSHVCSGVFSISESGDKTDQSKRRKLSRSEQKDCYSELKDIRLLYIKNLFLARKRYLDYLHEERIKKLVAIRDDAISDIKREKSN